MTALPQGDAWIAHFPILDRLPADIVRELIATSRVLRVPEGTKIFDIGQRPSAYLLLLRGSVRVQQVAENGRQIVLYRVAAGESCPLTTVCLLGHEIYRAEGIAEADCVAVAVAAATFDDLVSRSAEFRRFVFAGINARIVALFEVIDALVSSRIDIRLAHKLVRLSGGAPTVEATHQQLAAELGTAREVVSRQLHDFQRRGWISTSRGAIDLIDRAALERLGSQN
jgi:CRP/FNR family transcriptional regulator